MAEHEFCIGETSEWFTPPQLFEALGIRFDLDPCSPGPGHWVPAKAIYTKNDDGLSQPWFGRVFMNPPFGGRHDHLPWLDKFINHRDGIGIVRAYTSSAWWHDYIPRVDAVLFPRGKTQFVRPDGSIGKAPGHGVALIAMGKFCCRALKNSNLGMYWKIPRNKICAKQTPLEPTPLEAFIAAQTLTH